MVSSTILRFVQSAVRLTKAPAAVSEPLVLAVPVPLELEVPVPFELELPEPAAPESLPETVVVLVLLLLPDAAVVLLLNYATARIISEYMIVNCNFII